MRFSRRASTAFTPGPPGLLVLAYLRHGETFAELVAGFGIGAATAWRYVNETTALLAARSRRRASLVTKTADGNLGRCPMPPTGAG